MTVVSFGEAGGAVGGEVGCEFGDLLLCLFPSPRGFESLFDLLIDGGVEEHREDDRCGAIDGHGDAGFGGAEVKAGVEAFCVIERRDRDTGVSDFSVDVGTLCGVTTIERHGVKGGG